MAGSPTVQRTTSPVAGSVVAERELATTAQIDAILDRAVTAQRSWRHVPLQERAEVVGRLVTWMLESADAIGRELTWQMGRPVTHSPLELTRGFAERATWLAGAAAGAAAFVRGQVADAVAKGARALRLLHARPRPRAGRPPGEAAPRAGPAP